MKAYASLTIFCDGGFLHVQQFPSEPKVNKIFFCRGLYILVKNNLK